MGGGGDEGRGGRAKASLLERLCELWFVPFVAILGLYCFLRVSHDQHSFASVDIVHMLKLHVQAQGAYPYLYQQLCLRPTPPYRHGTASMLVYRTASSCVR